MTPVVVIVASVVTSFYFFLLLLLMVGDVVDEGDIVVVEGVEVTEVVIGRGVDDVVEIVKGVVLLVDEEEFDGGVAMGA
ncbi:hypothetical protein HKD37_19G054008 [Glycine soja]|nr:hypothetical protein GmHk_19G055294 [Glycine max]